jgi:hypothetical protein
MMGKRMVFILIGLGVVVGAAACGIAALIYGVASALESTERGQAAREEARNGAIFE